MNVIPRNKFDKLETNTPLMLLSQRNTYEKCYRMSPGHSL